VNGVAFSPDGKLLASANASGAINMWHTPGPGSDWIIVLLAALAIALAALAVLITTREIRRAGRGRARSWRKLRPS
jgi:WD40 repeat protein